MENTRNTAEKAVETFYACMGERQEILEVRPCTSLTNTNYYLKTGEGEYVLRLPGAGTSVMIDRRAEGYNSKLGEELGINVPTLYFDSETGVKITRYIPGAQPLTAQMAAEPKNYEKTAKMLRKLHTSNAAMKQRFSVEREYRKYLEEVKACGGGYYPGYWELDEIFWKLMERLETVGWNLCPCHNDLVPENLIKGGDGRMYLLDWEYAGINDPMWDLAAHSLECQFSSRTEEGFLTSYSQGEVSRENREKLLIFKISQDMLWTAWTILKEQKGEDFGTYGTDRLNRGLALAGEYQRIYGRQA